MAAVLQAENITVQRSGTKTTVPDIDICRLSYYLNCATQGCGVDGIPARLLDFKKAQYLSQEEQRVIVELAKALNLRGVTVFVVDPESARQLIPDGSNNHFLSFERARALIAVTSEVVVGGQARQIHKIMVCTSQWFDKYYLGPLRRYAQANRPSPPSSGNGDAQCNKKCCGYVVGACVGVGVLIALL